MQKIKRMLTKAKLKEQIEQLPDQFTIDELVERLVFLNKIEEGIKDSISGNKINENELEKLMKIWAA